MIQNKHPWDGRDDLIRYYSDDGKRILQVETGIPYDDAVDPYPSDYHYIETNIPIEASADGSSF